MSGKSSVKEELLSSSLPQFKKNGQKSHVSLNFDPSDSKLFGPQMNNQMYPPAAVNLAVPGLIMKPRFLQKTSESSHYLGGLTDRAQEGMSSIEHGSRNT